MFQEQNGIDMTTYNKATLKTFFLTGDVPTGNDYGNLIDSQVNIAETAQQNMAGSLSMTELNASRVSAGPTNLTSTLTVAGITSAADIYAESINASALNLKGPFSVSSLSANSVSVTTTISAASLYVMGDVSAATGTVYASAVRSPINYHGTPVVISAAGTAQTTGTFLTAEICRLQGASDGQATGFVLPANKTGWVQYLANECTVSANLWPPIGGSINGLGVNTVFPMTANTPYIVIHRAASAYSVK